MYVSNQSIKCYLLQYRLSLHYFFSNSYFSFHSFIVGLKRQTSIHLLDEVLVQPLRMLVQSEPHSHTEYVHFEPSPVMVSLGRIKDFHVVRAGELVVSIYKENYSWSTILWILNWYTSLRNTQVYSNYSIKYKKYLIC